MKEIEEKIGNYIVEYSNMEPEDVEDTYAVVANHEVTPEVYEACIEAIKVYKSGYMDLPKEEDEWYNVIGITDFFENTIVFAYGNGTESTDIRGGDVFYKHPCSDESMIQCYAMLQVIGKNDEEDDYYIEKNIERSVGHWFTDALTGMEDEEPDLFEGIDVTMYGYYDYEQCPWDPNLEVFNE